MTDPSAFERIFPHPPWPVVPGTLARRTFLGALTVAAGVLAGGWYEAEVVRDFARIQRDRAFWLDPTLPAGSPLSEVSASVRQADSSTKFILYSTTLEVAFEIAGTSQTQSYQVRTLFGALQGDVPARVRFDPRRPAVWSLNWAARARRTRMQALFVMAGGGLLVGGGVAFFGFALWIGADRVRRVALRGVTLAAEVTEVEEQKSYGRATGAVIHRFRMPASHGGKRREAVFSGAHPRPVLLMRGKLLLVCVLPNDPSVFVVPREDLYPFDFDESTRREILLRVNELK